MNDSTQLNPILNRDGQLPADGWYHVVPKGSYPLVSRGLTQLIDDAAIAAMMNNFLPKLLVDQEHWSYDLEKSSEAFGWCVELQNRAAGLWARIEWTDLGDTAIKHRRYRFISPVWLECDCEKLPDGTVRPKRVDSFGLTNSPNMKGMVALSNRLSADQAGNEFRQDASASEADKQTPASAEPSAGGQPHKNKMKRIAEKLGLSAEASEDSILGELDKLTNRAATAETQRDEIKNRAAALEEANAAIKENNKQLLDAQIENDLARFENRIAKDKREIWKKSLISNRAATLELLESLPEKGKTDGTGKVLNRADASNPTANTESAKPLKAEERWNKARLEQQTAGTKN